MQEVHGWAAASQARLGMCMCPPAWHGVTAVGRARGRRLLCHPCQQVGRRDGLLRISEWSTDYTQSISGVAREGDLVDVMVTDVSADGKFKVSRKAVLLADAAAAAEGDDAAQQDGVEPDGGDDGAEQPATPRPGGSGKRALDITVQGS